MSFRSAVLLAAVASAPGPLAAQHDYHNLDRGHPIATEDAFPIEWQAIEFTLPVHAEREGGAGRTVVAPEVAWGVIPNGMFGVAVPISLRDVSGSQWSMRGFGLVNVAREGSSPVAVALRVDGTHTTRGYLQSFGVVATRSFGLTRVHANAGVTIGKVEAAPELEPPGRWQASIAVDRTLWRHALLLAGEALLVHTLDGRTAWLGGAGVRWQLDPGYLLAAGVSRRLASDGPDLAVTLGLTRAISIRGGAR